MGNSGLQHVQLLKVLNVDSISELIQQSRVPVASVDMICIANVAE